MSRTGTCTINNLSGDKEVRLEITFFFLIKSLSKLFSMYPNLWHRIQTECKQCNL